MKYFATVNGEEHELDLIERHGRLEARLDGEPVEVGYEEVDRLGQVALLLGGRSYAVSIEGGSGELQVTVAGHLYQVSLEDEREKAAHAAERDRTQSGGDVKSIMPGVVVTVLVSEGDVVEAGQALIILEAMKMQNEIDAPSAGVVSRLHVREGEAVASGARLVTLKGSDEPAAR